ncbi:MAG TPA: type VI secretion protein IcmF/TssM N-terminal domain-containing protein [Tepidisphaeraceae bacterium]|jgi:hypothetical protein|nr:type VI secretion protein IcmF/TssM N-terminal domain-containing protein [Tepidisphaeraceae bacterium]
MMWLRNAIPGLRGVASILALPAIARDGMLATQLSDHDLYAGAIVVGGFVIFGLLLISIQLMLATRDRRRGAQLVKGGASADIRSLQKKFADAMAEFRRRGKLDDPASAPWYVMVGEPGAGKTEAIRHASINFVRGMNDFDAGIGGTLNVDWWVADKAILLDTAGRLMFEKKTDGRENEWQAALRLLKKARPRCPINGIILAIPCDHLYKASLKDVREKAEKIAAEFDNVQKELEIRFPVYILLTKADKLPGSRKFFANLKDEVSCEQMLGWSNPDNLDNAFSPQKVEEHFDSISQRLKRLRLSIMLDPKVVEPQSVRRSDQIDDLYGFPGEFQALGANLAVYLEKVFTPNHWSAKPLFLRGIYFTSAMQEGAELDVDLAGKLGLATRSRPATSIWKEEKTLFLRDVFLVKAFEEKGLVTSNANVTFARRLRNTALALALTGSAAAVVVWTVFGLTSLENSVGRQDDFWKNVDAAADKKFEVVSFNGNHPVYQGDEKINWDGPRLPHDTRQGVHELNLRLAQDDLNVPMAFRVWSKVGEDLKDANRRRRREFFEQGVLFPLVRAAIATIHNESRALKNETDETVATPEINRSLKALQNLIDLRAEMAGSWPTERKFEFQPLVELLEHGANSDDPPITFDFRNKIYGGPVTAPLTPPPYDLDAAIKNGVDDIVQYHLTSISGQLDHLNTLNGEVSAYAAAEDAFLRRIVDENNKLIFLQTLDGFSKFNGTWSGAVLDFSRKADSLQRAIALNAPIENEPMAKLLKDCKDRGDAALSMLEALAPPQTQELLPALKEAVARARVRLHAMFGKWQNESDNLNAEDDAILGWRMLSGRTPTTPGSKHVWQYQRRLAAYKAIADMATAEAGLPGPTDTIERLQAVVDKAAAEEAKNPLLQDASKPTELDTRAIQTCESASSFVQRARRSRIYERVLTGTALQNWEEQVRKLAAKNPTAAPARAPLTVSDGLDQGYAPEAAKRFFDLFEKLINAITADNAVLDTTILKSEARAAADGKNKYAKAYGEYWKAQVSRLKAGVDTLDWKSFASEAKTLDAADINPQLASLGKMIEEALEMPFVQNDETLPSILTDMKAGRDELAGGSPFAATTTRCAKSWSDLTALSLDDARKVLAGVSGAEMEKKYVTPDPQFRSNYAIRYWYDVSRGGLAVLARASENLYRDTLVDLKQVRGFPIRSDGDDLSPEAYADFRAKFTALHPREKKGGDPTSSRAIEQLRHRIIFGDVSSDDENWIDNADEMIAWITAAERCQLVLPAKSAQIAFVNGTAERSKLVAVYKLIQFTQAQLPPKSDNLDYHDIALNFDGNAGKASFNLWPIQDGPKLGQPPTVFSLPEKWPLHHLLRDAPWTKDKHDNIVVKMTSDQGEKILFVEIKIDAKIPDAFNDSKKLKINMQ